MKLEPVFFTLLPFTVFGQIRSWGTCNATRNENQSWLKRGKRKKIIILVLKIWILVFSRAEVFGDDPISQGGQKAPVAAVAPQPLLVGTRPMLSLPQEGWGQAGVTSVLGDSRDSPGRVLHNLP